MDWDLLNDEIIAISVIFSVISLAGLWLYSEGFDFCMEGSILSSIKTDSNNHKTIDLDNLWNTIPNCKTSKDVNNGFYLVCLGIAGNLFGGLFSIVASIIKKNTPKPKPTLNQEDRKDALGTHGYS